jgi:parallel beta-helix repeat protein
MKFNKIKIKRGELSLKKRGSIALLAVVVMLVVAISTSLIFAAQTDNSLTGAAIGVQAFKGACNISVKENVNNIGHDYICNSTNGFNIDADIDFFDCQGHTIVCVDCNNTNNTAGIFLYNRSGVEIRNCNIYNFSDGVRLEAGSKNNYLHDNKLVNNTDGIDINNGTLNNVSNNLVSNSSACGVNITGHNNSAVIDSDYNRVWNNKFYNGTTNGGQLACSNASSHNYWYLNKTCPSTWYSDTQTYEGAGQNTTNIIGGPCLGGNFWEDYQANGGFDSDGDGLGNTLLPYPQSGIGNLQRDYYPLIQPNGTCPALWGESVTLNQDYQADELGECLALISHGMTLDCQGYSIIGINGSLDDQRGIEIVGVNNVTVKNCIVRDFTYGIYVKNADHILLTNNTIVNNNLSGIYIGDLSDNVTVNGSTIFMNNFSKQQYGIWIQSAEDNKIISNTIVNNTLYGIYLSHSANYNTISSNYIANSTDGIYVNRSDGNNIYNNLIHNNSDAGIKVISSSLADLGETGKTNSTNTISNSTYGYYLESVTSSSDAGITGTLISNTYGLYMYLSNPNIRYVTARNNSHSGILLNFSTDVDIDYINISGSLYGLYLNNSQGINLSVTGYNEMHNNTRGLYLGNTSGSTFQATTNAPIRLYNNTYNLVLDNSSYNKFSRLTVFGGFVGINLTTSSYNNITKFNVTLSNDAGYNLYFSNSNHNLIYNNIFDNSTGGIDVFDNGYNTWNYSTSNATNNIKGYSTICGNWWSSYQGSGNGDTNGDGIGDDPVEYNVTDNAGTVYGNDSCPLTTPLIVCGNISTSFTFVKNMSVNGSCFIITADNVILNLAGYYLNGNGTGIGINISNHSNVQIINGFINNFTTAIYVDPSSNINITNNSIFDSDTGIIFLDVNNSHIGHYNISYGNKIFNNTIGINLTGSTKNNITYNTLISNSIGLTINISTNNSIYNNYFNNTANARDDGSINIWNYTYDCTTTNGSIISKNCSGGNFWSDYVGRDTGGGSSHPYTITNDGVGDTNLPYTTGITGGDRLPLSNHTGLETLSCQSITTTTILTGNVPCLSGDAITIAADDVTLDCNGFALIGGGTGAGISVDGKQNIVIKNCNITNFYYGIKLLNTKNVQIGEDNDIELNDFYGIYLYQANDTTIHNNSIIDDNNGVYMINSQNTTITNNTINLQKKFYGIYGFNSEVSKISNNTMWDNYHGIYLVNSSYTNISENIINDSDVYNLFIHKNTIGSRFVGNTFARGLEAIRIKQNSNSNVFVNNTLFNHTNYGIHITDSDSNTFTNNTIVNNSNNVYLTDSLTTTFINNTISLGVTGIEALSASNNLQLINNTINSTSIPSVKINDSFSAILDNNFIYNSTHINNADDAQIINNNTITTSLNITTSSNVIVFSNVLQYVNLQTLTGSNFSTNTLTELVANNFDLGYLSSNTVANNNLTALSLQSVTNTRIDGNNIQNTTQAINLYSSSNSNTIYDNWLKNNNLGLNLTSSSSSTIYNNYFSNTNNVFDDSSNTWNITYSCSSPNIVGGPCQGGNFYSAYYGLDNGANNREQGDGVGDQPSTFTINSGDNTLDYLPLVLYVARQYFDQVAPYNTTFNAYGNVSDLLANEEVVPNEVQIITYNSSSSGKVYLELKGLFNQSEVHAETLQVMFNDNKTAVNKTGVSGIANNHSVYLYHNNELDTGVFVCEDQYNLSLAENCLSVVNFTSGGTTNGYTLGHKDDYYKISGVTNQTITAGINKSTTYCGANIVHDLIVTQNITCNGSALTVKADNVTIYFNGYILMGDQSGIGINISGYNGVVIKDANIRNFSTGIYVDPVHDLNISNSNISNNSIGIDFVDVNNSYVVGNRIADNSMGINLTRSYGNIIFDNYFNNTINAMDNGSNTWNTTYNCSLRNNIIGGSCLGGNAWHNYTGWDTDLNGIGDTINYSILNSSTSEVTGYDALPLTEIGKISCGNVSKNVTLGRDVYVTNICFNMSSKNLLFDCAGYTIFGNQTGTAFNLSHNNLSEIRNCTLRNFSIAINMFDANNNTIHRNTIINNTFGINLTSSNNNSIYDNFFNNTNNSLDDGNNTWNITKIAGNNVAGGSYFGGNFWSNYNGSDNTSDLIGDSEIPYNNSGKIVNNGDYLPLVYTVSASSGSGGGSSSGTGDTPSSSSTSSGGGSSGGGSTKTTTVQVNCTQDWQCGDWSECIGGVQTRNCNDLNLCESKEDAGEVDNLIKKTKPGESKSCEMPEPPVIPDVSPPVEQPSIISQVIPPEGPARTITLASLATLLAVGGVLVYWQLGYGPSRLRRKLRKLSPLLGEEATEVLKDGYMGIYNLYMKLSEKHKQNFYTKVTKVREHIEEQLKAEKKIELLVHDESKGDLKERKQRYLDLYHHYQKLPAKVQKKYYSHIVHLRDQLERGR